jgi:hypothetical protein
MTGGVKGIPDGASATFLQGRRIAVAGVGAVPGQLDGVVIATAPDISAQVVRQCVNHDVRRVWFHRSFGNGSVSEEAVRECGAHGIDCIVGGCPLMFCHPVDVGHTCMRCGFTAGARSNVGASDPCEVDARRWPYVGWP